MNDTQNTTEDKVVDAISEVVTEEVVAVVAPDAKSAVPSFDKRGPRKPFGKNDRKTRREPRAKPEFEQKIIDIRRVTRVASGGRRFSFSVSMVVGNKKGMVGVATGKASDTALAIEKAYRAAKKNSIKINLTSGMTIPHEVRAKFKSATVNLSIAKGKGIVAGSAARDVVELAGIKDINTKLHSPSKNKLNIARATIKALSMLKKAKERVITNK